MDTITAPATITNINQLDLSKKYSYADYLQWKFDEYVELIKGKVFKKMSPAPLNVHQRVVRDLGTEINNFLKGKSCEMFMAPFDVRFPKTDAGDDKIYTVVQPDITVVCDTTKLDEKGCVGAPDMIVEVLSEGTAVRDWNFKYNLYEEAGVKEYWIIEPTQKSVTVFVLGKDNKYVQVAFYKAEATIPIHVLKDFTVKWSEIFSS